MADELCIIGQEKSESNLRLLEEAKKVFDSVFFVPLNGISIGLRDDFAITYRTTNILKFKAILPRISRQFSSYAYQLLSLFPAESYMAVRPLSFLLAEERFFLLTVLRKRGIPTANLSLSRTTEPAYRIIEQNNLPVIIRTPEKTTGVVVQKKNEAKTSIDALASLKQAILIEDVIKDLVSVYVSEPEVLATVKKSTKEKDILFAKGALKSYKANIEIQQLALDAAKAVEAQVARVDISLGKEPRVVNINLNPDLMVASKVTGTDIPRMVMEAVRDNYNKHKERPMLMRFFEDAQSVMKEVLKSKQLIL
jgi:glutathione synthase/RimK-type ligase-like ATP-grasp enzyme